MAVRVLREVREESLLSEGDKQILVVSAVQARASATKRVLFADLANRSVKELHTDVHELNTHQHDEQKVQKVQIITLYTTDHVDWKVMSLFEIHEHTLLIAEWKGGTITASHSEFCRGFNAVLMPV